MNIHGAIPESLIEIRAYGHDKAEVQDAVNKLVSNLSGGIGKGVRVDFGYRLSKKKKGKKK